MKLQVGVTVRSDAWEELLRQEGIASIPVDPESPFAEGEFSVLLVPAPLTVAGRGRVEDYLRHGGGVLGYAKHLEGVAGISSRSERIEYLVEGETEAVPWTGLLDLGLPGAIPREANFLRTQGNTFALFAGKLAGGAAVVLPFDAAVAFTDTRVVNKNFYAHRDRFPSERTALVGKGELLHLLHCALEFLHHSRALPYCHSWYYPDGKPNLFAFRVDSDGAPQADVDRLYRMGREHGIGISWYLDVRSHEDWLGYFAGMVDQEIGVHCYEHRVFDTCEANLHNIGKAKRLLEEHGMRPTGFTAPYGQWNRELARAVAKLGFDYSSEFTLAYDTLPFYPVGDDIGAPVLQVPIHPICFGSLGKIGYPPDQMNEYYRMVVETKLSRGEPLFFYHHPTHHSWSAVGSLFALIAERGIDVTTMGEYGRWWMDRRRHITPITLEGSTVRMNDQGTATDDRFRIRLSRAGGEVAVIPRRPQIELAEVPWRKAFPPALPSDIRRTREFDARGMIGDIYTRMMRRFS